MAVVLGDIVKFVAKGTMESGNEWNWVWHYIVSLGATETDLVVLTALRDHLDTVALGMEVHQSTSIDSTECELFVWDAVLNRFDGTAQIGWLTHLGTNVAEVVPNQLAMLMKAFTAVGRRQGRKYIPGLTETAVAGNAWSSASLAAALVFAAGMDNLVSGGALTLLPGTFNVDPLSALFETFENFAGVVAVDTVPSTQRRRKPNVGI